MVLNYRHAYNNLINSTWYRNASYTYISIKRFSGIQIINLIKYQAPYSKLTYGRIINNKQSRIKTRYVQHELTIHKLDS